jgi:hypothetical protein|tara:strand:- start:517 stop:723 length:207 start_codon:yes stop_codon:yes gene_type:complete
MNKKVSKFRVEEKGYDGGINLPHKRQHRFMVEPTDAQSPVKDESSRFDDKDSDNVEGTPLFGGALSQG